MKHDGGPAYPVASTEHLEYASICNMSLRDYFAAKALLGLISSDIDPPDCESRDADGIKEERQGYANNQARAAYRYADAMLAERDCDATRKSP